MTTIAFDGKSLSCDTLMVNGGRKFFLQTKLFKSKGFMLAGAGNLRLIQRVFNALKGATRDGMLGWVWEGEEEEEDRPEMLIFYLNQNRCYMFSGDQFVICLNRPVAIGSGGRVAMGAMMMGATSREAVKIASEIDIYTGGKIKTVTLFSQRKESK